MSKTSIQENRLAVLRQLRPRRCREQPPLENADPATATAKPAALPRAAQKTVPDHERNCKGAKNRLDELGRFQRLKVKNAEGKMVVMTQMQKQVLIDGARAVVKDNCNRR